MLYPILIGATAGARSMTPLAAVSIAAWNESIPRENGINRLLSKPLIAAGATALAVGELLGDKMKSAPDRIVLAGVAARLLTGAVSGAALAPPQRKYLAAAAGAAAAIAASYPTFFARIRSMRRLGQTSTGLVEDALVITAAGLVVSSAAKAMRGDSQAATAGTS